jgi:UDP-N-acetylmuramate: L-alanyl-gamma-D-glutamyl-meso-diaminopimelate ligase
MHNLAIALHLNGNQITGSDDGIFEPSRSRLKKYGLLPAETGWFPEKIDDNTDAIILGMHALADNPELLEAKKRKIRIYSYPEFLHEYSKDKIRVVVGGSHGKSTITAMIIHVLKIAGIEADYMVGAKLEGFDVMTKLTKTAKYIIIEGDEYPSSPIDSKAKFLHYHPHLAVISGIAWDHVDVFPSFDGYIDQFRLFLDSIEPGGTLFYNQHDTLLGELVQKCNATKTAYSPHPHRFEEGQVQLLRNQESNVNLKIFGLHNMSNLSAAQLVCRELGVTDAVFYPAISTFEGVSRRLELLSVKGNSFIYQDFAHAPTKVLATVSALRAQYPDHQLIVCLELQCYTSMCEFFIDHYSGTLDQADHAIVFYSPVAAEYKKIPLMTTDRIKAGFSRKNLHVFSDNREMLSYARRLANGNYVVAFLTCGRFGGLNIPEVALEFSENGNKL